MKISSDKKITLEKLIEIDIDNLIKYYETQYVSIGLIL